ncbi:hypothetical protein C0J52_19527 [Blattella germanica]|nr:hypothetical protein C0J52_19527 [Blattella germanica]
MLTCYPHDRNMKVFLLELNQISLSGDSYSLDLLLYRTKLVFCVSHRIEPLNLGRIKMFGKRMNKMEGKDEPDCRINFNTVTGLSSTQSLMRGINFSFLTY